MKINLEKNKALFIVFLALIGATPPLSTDMYLAAIPLIAETWNVGVDVINLTLVLWFVAFSFFILIFGSLSDKYGRKPVLIFGLVMFVISSFLCAMAQNPFQLIAFRILQGIGAASPSAIVMAIVRDKFTGRERQQALAYLMTIIAVAPMVAPIIGAMLLDFFSWRYIFILQGTVVLVSLFFAFSFKESIEDKLTTSLFRLVTRYTVHFSNKHFMLTSLSMGGLVLPFYGFIAFSPVYYISIYGLSEKMFSLFFGLNALSSMIGAIVSSRVIKKFDQMSIITFSIVGCVLGGFGIFLFADDHYLFFFAFMSIFSFFVGVSRPISGGLILGLVKTDVGSASSFITFYQFISGALCMAFVTADWPDPVLIYGLVILSSSLIVLLLWKSISKKLNPIF